MINLAFFALKIVGKAIPNLFFKLFPNPSLHRPRHIKAFRHIIITAITVNVKRLANVLGSVCYLKAC